MGYNAEEKKFSHCPQNFCIFILLDVKLGNLIDPFFKTFLPKDMRGFRIFKKLFRFVVICPHCGTQRGLMTRVVSHNEDKWPAVCPTTRINDPCCVPQRRKMTRVVSHNGDKCPRSWKKHGNNLVKHGQLIHVLGHNAYQWSALWDTARKTRFSWISPPNRKRNQNHPRLPLSGSKGRVWCKTTEVENLVTLSL